MRIGSKRAFVSVSSTGINPLTARVTMGYVQILVILTRYALALQTPTVMDVLSMPIMTHIQERVYALLIGACMDVRRTEACVMHDVHLVVLVPQTATHVRRLNIKARPVNAETVGLGQHVDYIMESVINIVEHAVAQRKRTALNLFSMLELTYQQDLWNVRLDGVVRSAHYSLAFVIQPARRILVRDLVSSNVRSVTQTLYEVMTALANAYRIITVLVAAVMPAYAARCAWTVVGH